MKKWTVDGHSSCIVEIVRIGSRASKTGYNIKIYCHMVKMSSQVQKIKSGRISLNNAPRALKFHNTGDLKNVTTEWKIWNMTATWSWRWKYEKIKVDGDGLCSVNIVKNGCRAFKMCKIYYHMVKMTSQVQKIKSGCISLNIARRALKFHNTGGHKNLTTEWKNFKHDCNMVMRVKVWKNNGRRS